MATIGMKDVREKLLPHRPNSVIEDWLGKKICAAEIEYHGKRFFFRFTAIQALHLMVVDKLAERGLKDLTLVPSALFPIHEPLIGHIENGVISHIEGSMNGPVGRACSLGKMSKACILRSHGGRYRAIQDGDIHIDVAFIAAPAADSFGNCNGHSGPSACGVMGYAPAAWVT